MSSGEKKTPNPRRRLVNLPKLAIDPLPPQPNATDEVKQKLSKYAQITIDNESLSVCSDDLKEEKELGSGQFGRVSLMRYQNQYTQKTCTFAVKQIEYNCFYLNANEIAITNNFREAGNRCPYLIKIFGALLDKHNYIWILTEVMDTSLDKFYRAAFLSGLKLLSELFLSKVAFAVLKALEYLNQSNILHRDVKPSNLLINENGDIKLCDFGISRYIQNSLAHSFKGTSIYLAPEVTVIPETGYSFKVDVWSLGITLIEIATGAHPYAGCRDFGLVTEIVELESPKLNGELFSDEIRQFVNKSLIKDPNLRYGCADLLRMPFITQYADTPNDLAFIKSIIDLIKSERQQPNVH